MPSVMTAAHLDTPRADEDPSPPVAEAPVFYRHVDPANRLAPEAFLPAGDRVALLAAPLLVQTPTVMLASPVWEDDDAPPPHAHLALPPAFAAFAAEVEAAVLRAALANKQAWFRGPVDDRTVVAAFKQLCKASGHLKVALPGAVEVFDPSGEPLRAADLGVGDHVRCILRLDGIVFGRTEFGAMWTLVQAQTRPPAPPPPPPPRCLLSPEDDEEPQPEHPGPARPQPDAAAEFL